MDVLSTPLAHRIGVIYLIKRSHIEGRKVLSLARPCAVHECTDLGQVGRED